MSYGETKRTASAEAVPLCGIVPSYRTLLEDFGQFVEFIEWLNQPAQ